MKSFNAVAVALVAAGGVAASAAAMPTGFSDWAPATRVEAQPGTPESFNGPALDGCPFISRDERTFYMASNRAGGLGGIDIWVAAARARTTPGAHPRTQALPSIRRPTTSAQRSIATTTRSSSSATARAAAAAPTST